MEQNLPTITKKLWNMVRLGFFMLRKGICKKKILLDINLFMKRGRVAGKVALNNLIFHHNHPHVSASRGGVGVLSGNPQSAGLTDASRDYEFSCKSTAPLTRRHHITTTNTEDDHDHHYNNYFIMSPPNFKDQFEYEAVNKALNSILSTKHTVKKQQKMSITDSPFQLENENHHVDAAADAFIKRFYSQLMQQDC